MADIRTNIFGIGEVYELQKEGQWVERNRESYREYGYFGGESIPLDRVDFSNDTATATIRNTGMFVHRSGTVGNKNFGYFSSGYVDYSGIQRLDYSNDTTHSRRANLPFGRQSNSGVGNNNFGYWVGGLQYYQLVPNVTYLTSVDRMDYSNDLVPLVTRASLTIARQKPAVSNNSNFGYISSGGNNLTSVERISFSNDNITPSFRGFITIPSFNGGVEATGNNNFGYYGGGAALPTGRTTICRIDYANDTANASIRGPLNGGRWGGSACGNSNFGYFGAGTNYQPSGYYGRSDVERIDYSNDTVNASFRGPLNIGTAYGCSVSSGSFGGSPVSYLGAPWTSTAPFGYFAGGVNSSPTDISTVDRIDYANDTNTAVVRTFLQSTIYEPTGVSNNNFGYFGGGVAAPGLVSRVDRIDYANDTGSTSNRGPLSIARETRATGNSNFGYFGGGSSPVLSTIDRISYSNDTVTALTRSILSAARYRHTATGNSNFGYFMGGRTPSPPPYFSTVDRLDYSSDTTNTSVRGPLSYSISNFGSTGNNNFGYVAGGAPNSSIVNRIDYLNDTSTASVRGPLTVSIQVVATGNSNFGYFGLGFDGAVNFSDLYRVDYSNDTQTATVRGKASQSKRQLATSSSQAYGGAPNTAVDPLPSYIRAATQWIDSNTLDLPFKRVLGSYGYFYGGFTYSNIHRIDFSNDTTLVTRPILTANLSTQEFMCGFGNNNYGYAAGGGAFSYPSTSLIQRIDYSNDSSSSSIRGSLSVSRGAISGSFSNNNYGYVGGGFQNGVGFKSTVDRLDFSNDLNTAITKGSLSLARSSMSGMVFGNTFGYFGSGASGVTTNGVFEGDTTIINRVSFSNDIITTPLRGKMTVQRGRYATSYNSNYGWFAGGRVPGAPNGVIVTSVERIDFSNDLITNSTRGSLNEVKNYFAGTGNETYGWFSMGEGSSKIERINYSNDLVAASIRQTNAPYVSLSIGTTNARSS